MNVLQRTRADVSKVVRIYQLVIAAIVLVDMNLRIIKKTVKLLMLAKNLANAARSV